MMKLLYIKEYDMVSETWIRPYPGFEKYEYATLEYLQSAFIDRLLKDTLHDKLNKIRDN